MHASFFNRCSLDYYTGWAKKRSNFETRPFKNYKFVLIHIFTICWGLVSKGGLNRMSRSEDMVIWLNPAKKESTVFEISLINRCYTNIIRIYRNISKLLYFEHFFFSVMYTFAAYRRIECISEVFKIGFNTFLRPLL